MAAEEPPTNVPRIADVQNPASGHYVVVVRMPTHLAGKFPDKPWGTAINQIGLSKQDADKFPDYVLVDVDPLSGSPDLFWIFQKLDGPEWTTKSLGQESLIPQKYRRLVTTVRTKQDVTPGTDPTPITGDLTSSVVEQQDNTGKAIRVDTTEVIEESAEPLLGQQAYRERQVVDTEESIVVEGTPADAGLLISGSTVTPLGNGKSIKETAKVDAWVELTEIQWDDKLNAPLRTTEQFVAPPAVDAVIPANTSYKIVNEDRSLKITEAVPTEALASFLFSTPVRVDLGDLPRELISVSVVWNSNYSIGTQDQTFFATDSGTSYSLSASESDQASSSASIQPDIQLKYRDIASNNLFGTRHQFALPNPVTVASIIARLEDITGGTVLMWPVFKPVSETITATSQSIKVAASASVGLGVKVSDSAVKGQSAQKTVSDDFSSGLAVNSIQTPPCIHGEIKVTGGTSRSQLVSATALLSMAMVGAGANQITAMKTKAGTAYGAVSPTTLPATGGSSTIPTSGLYILDFDTQQYKWDHTLVSVVVFDASDLA